MHLEDIHVRKRKSPRYEFRTAKKERKTSRMTGTEHCAVRCRYLVVLRTQPTEKKKIPNARSVRLASTIRYLRDPSFPSCLPPHHPTAASSKQQARSHAPPSQAVLYAVLHPCLVDQPAKPAALLPSLVPRPPSCPPADPWAVRHPTIAAGITSSAVRLLPPPCVGSSGPACYRALRNRLSRPPTQPSALTPPDGSKGPGVSPLPPLGWMFPGTSISLPLPLTSLHSLVDILTTHHHITDRAGKREKNCPTCCSSA